MPKNVVGRLRNLQNEMNNVLSICETPKNEQKISKPAQKREKPLLRSMSSNMGCARHGLVKVNDEHATNMSEEPIERPLAKEMKVSGNQRKEPVIEKPNSAPTGALCTINETESHTKRKRIVQRAPKKVEGIAADDSLEWFDCSPQTCETSERTLRPAEEILMDISQYGNENYIPKSSMIWCKTCGKRIYDCLCHQHHQETHYHSMENDEEQPEETDDEENRESFLQLIKPDLKENPAINELARKIEQREMEVMSAMREDHRKMIKCPHRTMQGNTSHNEIKIPNKPGEPNTQTGEFHKSEALDAIKVQVQNSRSNGRPATAPASPRASETRSPNRYGMITRLTRYDEDGEGNSEIDIPENAPNTWKPPERDHYRENENIRTVEEIIDDPNYVQWIEDAMIEQQESESDAESSAKLSEDLKNLKHKKNLSDATTRKIAEIIERNHQKIEQMRKSRFLALSTVKSMKEKYDALAQMKNNMEEKLDLLIKSNRLRSCQKLKGRQNRRSSQYR